jgi:hypothetical protein
LHVYPFFVLLRKMQMKVLKEMHYKLKQLRVNKNGSTWPINMFSLILTLPKWIYLAN